MSFFDYVCAERRMFKALGIDFYDYLDYSHHDSKGQYNEMIVFGSDGYKVLGVAYYDHDSSGYVNNVVKRILDNSGITYLDFVVTYEFADRCSTFKVSGSDGADTHLLYALEHLREAIPFPELPDCEDSFLWSDWCNEWQVV